MDAENAAPRAMHATGAAVTGESMKKTHCRRGLLWAACALLATAQAAAAQFTWLPEVRHFRSPLADPMGPRIAASLLSTNLLATQGPERPPFTLPDPERSAREVVAAVGIGAVFPLAQLATWPGGGVQLVADGRVFARFRIEYPTRDDMGQDWWVGGGIEMADGPWSGRALIMHRSSHIGDEFALQTGAQRIEFGSEQLDLLAARDLPGVARFYGGGSLIFRSYLGWEPLLADLGIDDRALLQVGADREWRLGPDPRLVGHAGIDVHVAERTDWQPGIAAAVGLGIRTRRALRLTLRGYDGMSMMGEFFLTRERYLALEMSAEF
jgi:hypothetical protein